MRPAADRHREDPESQTQDEGYQAHALQTESEPIDRPSIAADAAMTTQDLDLELDDIGFHPEPSHDPACSEHLVPDHPSHPSHHSHHSHPSQHPHNLQNPHNPHNPHNLHNPHHAQHTHPHHIHLTHHPHHLHDDSTPHPPEYDLDSVPDPADHDQDMSDSDGGAPLNLDDDHFADIDFYPPHVHVPFPQQVPFATQFAIPELPFLTDSDEYDDEDQGFANSQYPYFPTNSMGLQFAALDNSAMDSSDEDYFDPSDLPSELVETEPMFDSPVMLSNPSPGMMGSENLHLVDTLRSWAIRASTGSRSIPARFRTDAPKSYSIRDQAYNRRIHQVQYEDLHGDGWDLQGLDWGDMGISRRNGRDFRNWSYKNYVNKPMSDKWKDANPIPSDDDFFRFKRMTIRQDVRLAHFQLRSVLACPSRNYAYYSGDAGIIRMNLYTGKTEVLKSMNDFPGINALISTIDSNHDILMAGTFNGEYRLQNLRSDDKKKFIEGQITRSISGITNHVQIHKSRQSGVPLAAISSNDFHFRIMDLTTQKMTLEARFHDVINCSALSPDSRLRVMVGDSLSSLIVEADTGRILQKLDGHRDFGFACDWSDDGWTVATGNQDMAIKIWDARFWCDSSGKSTPITTIRTELAGARGLRFSPGGSGPRVLVAAEEADYIHIIDAETFHSKQTFDVISELGGLSFCNDGQDLCFLLADHHRGGILHLERCGREPEPYFRNTLKRTHGSTGWTESEDDLKYVDEKYTRRGTSHDAIPIF